MFSYFIVFFDNILFITLDLLTSSKVSHFYRTPVWKKKKDFIWEWTVHVSWKVIWNHFKQIFFLQNGWNVNEIIMTALREEIIEMKKTNTNEWNWKDNFHNSRNYNLNWVVINFTEGSRNIHRGISMKKTTISLLILFQIRIWLRRNVLSYIVEKCFGRSPE